MSDSFPPAGPPSGPPAGTPFGGPSGPPPSGPPPSGPPPEVLQSGAGSQLPPSREPRSGSGRKGLFIGGGAVALLALAGGVAWAAMSFFGTGPQPAEALPGGSKTLAYASIDLDPSGGQKIAALKTLRKFPGLKDKIGATGNNDIVSDLFKDAQKDGTCKSLDYDKDIKPWLGSRAAIAAEDLGGDTPEPVLAVQVKDAGKAKTGIKKLMDCSKDSDSADSSDSSGATADSSDDLGGFVVSGDWAILAESKAKAQTVVDEAKKSPLSDDADFKKWTSAAGDSGIVTLYAAPAAGDYLAGHLGDFGGIGSMFGGGTVSESGGAEPSGFPTDFPSDYPTGLPSGFPTDFPTDLPSGFPTDFPSVTIPAVPTPSVEAGAFTPPQSASGPSDQIKDALKSFEGAAVIIRFHNGAIEAEGAGDSAVASKLGPGYLTSDKGSDVIETLPKDTGAAVGIGFVDGWFTKYLDSVGQLTGTSGSSASLTKEFTDATGLQPDDVETLLGSSAAISVDGNLDFDAISNSDDASDLPVALKVKGDPDKIKAVLAKVQGKLGADQATITQSDSDGDTIVIGPDSDYRKQTLADGKLGDSDLYKNVIGHRDGASAVLFVDVNAFEKTIDKAVQHGSTGEKEFVDNLKTVQAVGMSSWVDGSTSHFLLRLTTN